MLLMSTVMNISYQFTQGLRHEGILAGQGAGESREEKVRVLPVAHRQQGSQQLKLVIGGGLTEGEKTWRKRWEKAKRDAGTR